MALVLGLGVNVLLARLLGPTEFGTYVFALTVMTLVAVPLHSGIVTLLVREVASTAASGAWGHLRGSIAAANWAVLAALTLVMLISGLLLCLYPISLGSSLWFWALILLPFYCLASLRGAALRGLQRPVLGQLPDAILRPALLAIGLIILGGSIQLEADNAMALHVVAAICTFLIGATLLRQLLPTEVRKATAEYYPKLWFRAAVPLTLITSIQALNNSLAVLFLGKFGTSVDVAVYRVADLGSSLILLGLIAGDTVLGPRVAALYLRGDLGALQKEVTSMTRITLAVALPIVILTTVFGEALIQLFFGPTFIAARWPLSVLSLAQFVIVGIGAVGSMLIMTGHERDVMGSVAVATVLNLLLCLILIPRWGATGAGVAVAVSLVALNLVMFQRVWFRLGIRSGPLG